MSQAWTLSCASKGVEAMVTKAEFIQKARTWLGTPYRHQGRLKNISCDCIGLVICVCRELGLQEETFDVSGYSSRPDGTLLDQCELYMKRVPIVAAQPADILVFNWKSEPHHVAIMTGPTTIIHAHIFNRRVVEHSIDDRWRAAMCAAYSVDGVT